MFAQTVIRALPRLGLEQRGSDPHPRQPAPMFLQKADAMFASADWTYEPKWDGFLVLATVRDGSVRLISRNGHSFTNLFWPISDALRGFRHLVLSRPLEERQAILWEMQPALQCDTVKLTEGFPAGKAGSGSRSGTRKSSWSACTSRAPGSGGR